MIDFQQFLNQKIINIVADLGITIHDGLVRPSGRPDLSDYQSNIALSLAKQLKTSPRELAKNFEKVLSVIPEIKSLTIDGPGFINIKLADHVIVKNADSEFTSFSHRKIVIDFGGANIAKEMHVGHLRSAIIGESVRRIMLASGDKVIGDVHLGDWGTPIGMLIAQLEDENANFMDEVLPMTIADISALYKRAAANFKGDDNFKKRAREATFKLQDGQHADYLSLWRMFRRVSVEAIRNNYDELGASFDLWLGESDVNDLLAQVVDELIAKEMAVESDGALVVFLPPKNGKDRAPLILKKSDGAYTYATTDLATIVQRVKQFQPDNILYVVDARQKEHFEQVFEVARLAGYVGEHVSLEHLAFGTINGKDGKPFKTRSGETVYLTSLLDFAKSCARDNLPKVSSEYSQKELQEQADQIAIAAIKYQDLKNNRLSNYIFDTDHFTQFEGKTGPYLQYAIARINSIVKKVEEELLLEAGVTSDIVITHPLERELLLLIAQQPEYMLNAYHKREPSIIAEYVYLLAQKFSSFYAELSVLNEPDKNIQQSRLHLVRLVRKTLLFHLNLLGIEAPEKMLRSE